LILTLKLTDVEFFNGHDNMSDDGLKDFIKTGLSLVCASSDSELNKLYFHAAEQAGIIEKTDKSTDYRINGVNYKLCASLSVEQNKSADRQ
jgi:hypothetical protein